MKSYWITATIVLFATWPLSSNAVAGTDQVKADEKPAQTESSSLSSTAQDSAKAQTVSAAVSTNAASQSAVKTVATPQAKSSYFLVELSRTLKVNKLKPGDKVKAQIAQDVVSHGKVIIPVETEVVGHVTEVSVRDTENPESRLGIVFDKILLKHFHDISLQAVVQAVSPPVQRRSLSLESQMLPPSMMAASRQTSVTPAGGSGGGSGGTGGSGSGRGSPSPSTTAGPTISGDMSTTYETPVSVKQSPTTNTSLGGPAAQLETAPGAKAMSIGMPQGVTGLKGLSLSPTPTASTPGPVIVSNTQNVKLESGTQILLRVMTIELPKADSAKR